MTLQEFKSIAIHRGTFHDNHANAAKGWAKGWGFGFIWQERWFFKEYKVGNLLYKSGIVRGRWSGERVTHCFIGTDQVSEYKFKKALASFVAPAPTAEEQAYIDNEHAKYLAAMERIAKRTAKIRAARNEKQLKFDFNAA